MPFRGPVGSGGPSGGPREIRTSSCMSERGRYIVSKVQVALPEVREALAKVWEGS